MYRMQSFLKLACIFFIGVTGSCDDGGSCSIQIGSVAPALLQVRSSLTANRSLVRGLWYKRYLATGWFYSYDVDGQDYLELDFPYNRGNRARYACGGHSAGRDVWTTFYKVRVIINGADVKIDASDLRFADRIGSCTIGGVDVCKHDLWIHGGSDSCWWGRARSCTSYQLSCSSCASDPSACPRDCGSANLDLHGTPFKFPANIETLFKIQRWGGSHSFRLSTNRKSLDVYGGGFCGDVGLRYIPLEYDGSFHNTVGWEYHSRMTSRIRHR